MADSTPNYLPGMEPENIHKLLESFFSEIDDSFPDGIIIWSEWKHDRWDKAAGYLCKTLGYERGKQFLEAYGYSVIESRNEISRENATKQHENHANEKIERSNNTHVNAKKGTKNLIWIIIIALLIVFGIISGQNNFEKTSKSAYNKFVSGDFDSMNAQERALIDGFLKSLG